MLFISDDLKITWNAFCKDNLPDRKFSFWDWFYGVMKLTRDHLSDAWNEDLIYGFISRQQTENKLLESPSGTFLFRFADRILGK